MEAKDAPGSSWSLAATKCIERTRREHEDLFAEFKSCHGRRRGDLGSDWHEPCGG